MTSQKKEKSASDEFEFASLNQMSRMRKMCCPEEARFNPCITGMQKAADMGFCCVPDNKSFNKERTKK